MSSKLPNFSGLPRTKIFQPSAVHQTPKLVQQSPSFLRRTPTSLNSSLERSKPKILEIDLEQTSDFPFQPVASRASKGLPLPSALDDISAESIFIPNRERTDPIPDEAYCKLCLILSGGNKIGQVTYLTQETKIQHAQIHSLQNEKPLAYSLAKCFPTGEDDGDEPRGEVIADEKADETSSDLDDSNISGFFQDESFEAESERDSPPAIPEPFGIPSSSQALNIDSTKNDPKKLEEVSPAQIDTKVAPSNGTQGGPESADMLGRLGYPISSDSSTPVSETHSAQPPLAKNLVPESAEEITNPVEVPSPFVSPVSITKPREVPRPQRITRSRSTRNQKETPQLTRKKIHVESEDVRNPANPAAGIANVSHAKKKLSRQSLSRDSGAGTTQPSDYEGTSMLRNNEEEIQARKSREIEPAQENPPLTREEVVSEKDSEIEDDDLAELDFVNTEEDEESSASMEKDFDDELPMESEIQASPPRTPQAMAIFKQIQHETTKENFWRRETRSSKRKSSLAQSSDLEEKSHVQNLPVLPEKKAPRNASKRSRTDDATLPEPRPESETFKLPALKKPKLEVVEGSTKSEAPECNASFQSRVQSSKLLNKALRRARRGFHTAPTEKISPGNQEEMPSFAEKKEDDFGLKDLAATLEQELINGIQPAQRILKAEPVFQEEPIENTFVEISSTRAESTSILGGSGSENQDLMTAKVQAVKDLAPESAHRKVGRLIAAECRLCGDMVVQHLTYQRRHVWKVHMNSPTAIFCPVEGCEFTTSIELHNARVHVRKKHPEVSITDIIDKRNEYGDQLQEFLRQCFPVILPWNRPFKQYRRPFNQRLIVGESSAKTQCKLCERSVHCAKFREHIWDVHLMGATAFQCPQCDFSVGLDIKAIRDHVAFIHKSSVNPIDRRKEQRENVMKLRYQCFGVTSRYGRKLKSLNVLTNSASKISQLPKITCMLCFQQFPDHPLYLKSHVWREHLGNPVGWACPYCPYTTGALKQGLQLHIKSRHPSGDPNKVIDKRDEQAPQLKKRYTECFGERKRHQRKVRKLLKKREPEVPDSPTETRDYPITECQICHESVRIANQNSLKNHVWVGHMDNPQALKCPLCPRTYGFILQAMKTHVSAVHGPEKIDQILDDRQNYSEEVIKWKQECFGKGRKKGRSLGYKPMTHRSTPTLSAEMRKNVSQRRLREKYVPRKSAVESVGKKYFCRLCEEEVCGASSFILKAHVWRYHLGNPKALFCKLCDWSTQVFPTFLKKHIQEKHPGEDENDFVDIRSTHSDRLAELHEQCFGPKKARKNPMRIKRKSEEHSIFAMPKEDCQLCGVSVISMPNYRKFHVWINHLGDPISHGCAHCDFTSNGLVNYKLKQHMKTKHPDEDPRVFIDRRREHAEKLAEMAEMCFGRKLRFYSSAMDTAETKDCNKCGSAVKTNNALTNFKAHVWKNHLGTTSPDSYACPKCDYKDQSYLSSSFYNHAKFTHVGDETIKVIDLREPYRERVMDLVRECFDYAGREKGPLFPSELPRKRTNPLINSLRRLRSR